MAAFEDSAFANHERVIFCSDVMTGLRAIIECPTKTMNIHEDSIYTGALGAAAAIIRSAAAAFAASSAAN